MMDEQGVVYYLFRRPWVRRWLQYQYLSQANAIARQLADNFDAAHNGAIRRHSFRWRHASQRACTIHDGVRAARIQPSNKLKPPSNRGKLPVPAPLVAGASLFHACILYSHF